MILQSLVRYYDSLAAKGQITKMGYCTAPVGAALILKPDGTPKGIITQKEKREIPDKKTVDVSRKLQVPEQVVKTSGISSNFMCENSSYIFGVDKKGNPEWSKRCFEAAKKLHIEILKEADSPAAAAVKSYFSKWSPEMFTDLEMPDNVRNDIISGSNIVFCDEDFHYLHSNMGIISAWDKYYNANKGTLKQRCLVTGKEDVVAILHGKIKGVDGAQSAGANIVSFNDSAFESYGHDMEKGLNAPVGKTAAYAYVTVLNKLLSERKNHTKIGDTTIVWWSEIAEESAQNMFSMVYQPGSNDGDKLSSVMNAYSQGRLYDIEGINMHAPFCILGLAPSAGRLSVRFFYRNEFGLLLSNLVEHYKRLEIIKPDFITEYITPYKILKETIFKKKSTSPDSKEKNKSASPILSGAVMRAILNNLPYPEMLFNAILIRIRAEREISYEKAAIIKAYLLKKQNNKDYKEVLTVSLNEENTNKAYVLGRLFAVLERAQEEANLSSTIKDRYFTSACACPVTVFPYLIKLSVHHQKKSQYGGNRDYQITQLMDKLDSEVPFPSRMTNEEQGLFILGYYHQTQARYTKKTNDSNNESEE